jgi:hypothetical protein
MMDSLFVQIFLLLNVFLMGALAAIAIRHAYAHFRPPAPHEPEKSILPPVAPVDLPPAVKERLIHEAEANFLAVLNSSIGELQHDLRLTAQQLNKQLDELGAEVATGEKERYSTMLEELRKQTQAAISGAQAEISQHQAELKAKMTEAVSAEQQQLIRQIDTKLADAVASFLAETLQHNVDLGAQQPYLLALLEEHKDDFKKEVADETPAAK